MIVGVCGHVDHGKTHLVKALTGVDTDRLIEEKTRQITTELGFAHTECEGLRVSFIDMPGHEKFVRAMAAGAAGIDVALLVIAIDEGVCAQTKEHVEICHLLNVSRGVICLSRCDKKSSLTAEHLRNLSTAIDELTRGTCFESAVRIETSAITLLGINAVKKELARLASTQKPANGAGPLFLPVDRVFTLRGFGTIVTGTLLSGMLDKNEKVSFRPQKNGPFRIRSIQRHAVDVNSATTHERVALNIPQLEVSDIHRGVVLTRFDETPAQTTFEVELQSATKAPLIFRPHKKWSCLLAGQSLEVRLNPYPTISQPNEGRIFARMSCSAGFLALPDMRFILREKSATRDMLTVCGGRVLLHLKKRLRPKEQEWLQRYADSTHHEREVMRQAREQPAKLLPILEKKDAPVVLSNEALQIQKFLETRKTSGPSLEEIVHATKIQSRQAAQALSELDKAHLCARAGELFFSKASILELQKKLEQYFATQKEISTQQFKELVGLSRKFVIPLAEYFDREKVTLRVGDKRTLRKKINSI